MSDGPNWNAPFLPGPDMRRGPAAVPVTGVGPKPLPLPPGVQKAPGERMSTRRISMIVASAVLLLLLICGSGIAALVTLMPAPFAGSDGSDVLQSQWADSGRFAVVEYRSGGTDATSSVVAWDSATLETHKIDGYRLVAVEPSSTRVWVTRAMPEPAYSEADPPVTGEESPWSSPDYGGSLADGPGAIWSWDAAAGGAPTPATMPDWTPWTGGAGLTAKLGVDESVGLWPSRLSFASTGVATVAAELDPPAASFLPIGWSPSGRYFAIRSEGFESDPYVTVFDGRTGTAVSSYSGFLDTASAGDSNTSWQFGGAAWDPARDVVWISESESDDSAGTFTVHMSSLDASGTVRALGTAPAKWTKTDNAGAVLGTSPDGVLLGIDGSAGQSIWRIEAGQAVQVPAPDNAFDGTAHVNAYSVRNGFLATVGASYAGAGTPRVQAVAIDPKTGRMSPIWPLGR